MIPRFPKFKAGYIFNEYTDKIDKNLQLKYYKIKTEYPCRIDAMAINPSAVCYNGKSVFTPGEVVISINRKIKVNIEVISEIGGILEISERTQRKVLIRHAYGIISKTLNVNPSLKIDVDSSEIIKHCGFGSSSSTIAAVASAINELYGCQINNKKLIKFLASNHGEEISDENEEDLKLVQCIGGGATNGLTEEGIIIIAGKATSIAKLKYDSEVLIAIPKDFKPENAEELMKLEEENLWKFKETGDKYSKKIAYDLLHKALPDINNGSIKELAEVVFDYRFNMGSIANCSFTYKNMMENAKALRNLYEKGHCEFLTLSSVGPAFFAIVKNEEQKKICKDIMENVGMNVIETSICNSTYEIIDKKELFWVNPKTSKEFSEKPVSEYIIKEINEIIKKKEIKSVIDVGCGGGRYSRYLKNLNFDVLAVDKYEEMAKTLKKDKINFLRANMDNIPVKSENFDMIISTGVIHNAITKEEFIQTIKEFKRILKNDGYVILSVFTNDTITDDLISLGNDVYMVKDRPSMVLLSKNDINKIIKEEGFNIEKFVDEHVTDVGTGKRNVYTVKLKK